MFTWRRTRTASSLPVPSPARSGRRATPTLDDQPDAHHARVHDAYSGDDPALEAFVTVLRAFGRYSFDLEHEGSISFSQQCEAWARHLLILAPPPTNAVVTDDGSALAQSGCPRDWPTVLQFLVTRRHREQQHVNKALGDLRQGIWEFAQSLGSALIEDQRSDDHMKSQIDRLKVAAEKLSTEEIKNEMLSAASSLSRLVSERQEAHRMRLEHLGARVTDLAGQLHDARQENVRDGLTQLVNRKGFDEFMKRMVFMRDVFGEAASLLMVDVDYFKRVNDTYGHPGGDAVLKALADCLVRNFPRKSDMVARFGGEEFVVVLPDTSRQNAGRLAERTRLAVRGLQVIHGGRPIGITISVGVAQLGRHESIQSWLERADQALYLAKSGGRDRVVAAIDAD